MYCGRKETQESQICMKCAFSLSFISHQESVSEELSLNTVKVPYSMLFLSGAGVLDLNLVLLVF